MGDQEACGSWMQIPLTNWTMMALIGLGTWIIAGMLVYGAYRVCAYALVKIAGIL